MADASATVAMDKDKLKVTDLKRELKLRGLSTAGTKSELITRLHNSNLVTPTEDVNDDDVLGDVDEILAEDPKAEGILSLEPSLALIEDEIILSPTKRVMTAAIIPPSAPAAKSALNPSGTKIVAAVPPTQSIKNADKVSPVAVTSLSSQKRLELRAKRFCSSTPNDAQKLARAERFGLAANLGQNKSTNGASLEKLQQRAERFGQIVSPAVKQLEEKNRLIKRKERFGAVVATSQKVDSDEKKRKRAERFGML